MARAHKTMKERPRATSSARPPCIPGRSDMNGARDGRTGLLVGTVWAVLIACLCAPLPVAAQAGPPPAPPAAGRQPALTVDALSVVKVRSRAVADARSPTRWGPSARAPAS